MKTHPKPSTDLGTLQVSKQDAALDEDIVPRLGF